MSGGTLSVFVNGTPVPKGSFRSFRNSKTGAIVTMNDNKGTKPWQLRVEYFLREEYFPRPPKEGPVLVFLNFIFPRPKCHFGTGKNSDKLKTSAPKCHTKKPDIDKLARSILDAITDAGVIKDDAQVVRLETTKQYVEPGCAPLVPGVYIEIQDLFIFALSTNPNTGVINGRKENSTETPSTAGERSHTQTEREHCRSEQGYRDPGSERRNSRL